MMAEGVRVERHGVVSAVPSGSRTPLSHRVLGRLPKHESEKGAETSATFDGALDLAPASCLKAWWRSR